MQLKLLIKLLLCLICATILLVIYIVDITKVAKKMQWTFGNVHTVKDNVLTSNHSTVNDQNKNPSLKYILMWTHNFTYPFIYLKEGRQAFLEQKCEYTNCYVTNDREYLPSLTEWDAIIFHAPEFTWPNKAWDHGFPNERSTKQKYIFTCIESADNYPSCDPKFNNYFNWTWTYKVDSDVRWGYMGIRDLTTGKIIGPNVEMHWEPNMTDISKHQKMELKSKTKAAAWFVSNCYTKSKREFFAEQLKRSLLKYNLNIDVYGKCGKHECERDSEKCWQIIKNDYFFYLSFENSFSEDYVTEKFLHAMKHGAVPIV